jgi:magnesium transporter
MIRIVATRGDMELLTDVSVEALPGLLDDPTVLMWVDLSGEVDPASDRIVREIFRFHPLAIEDCFEAREQPKIDDYDTYLYIITHGLTAGSTALETDTVELDAFVGKRYLLTYHAKPSRSIAGAADLVARGGGPLRRGPAALLHMILDRQVDDIVPVLDGIEEHIETLEERVFARPTHDDLETLLALKRTTLHLRRWISKQRDIMLRLSRSEFGLIPASEAIQFRDIYDHLLRFTDHLENFREMTTSIQEAHMSVTNIRLGEIMKFLTLFTAVLMPLTVITGIYGMNFEYMPELKSRWGYPTAVAAMVLTSGIILGFFRWRGWLGKPPRG